MALGGGFSGFFELYGDEGVGKTGLLMSLFRWSKGIYVDLDGTFPTQLTHLMGNETGTTIIKCPDLSKDDALSILSSSCEGGAELVVFDPIGVWDDWAISDFASKAHVMSMKSGTHIGVANHCHAAGNSKGDISLKTYCHMRVEIRSSEHEVSNGMVVNYSVNKNIYDSANKVGSLTIGF